MTVTQLLDWITDRNACGEVILTLPEPFNRCIIGTVEDAATGMCRVVYDQALVIGEVQLSAEPKMSLEDAQEFFEFNILCAYQTPAPPLFMEVARA
jgi:hypothetical protein